VFFALLKVWISLMGNDALDTMPQCAATGKTAAQCGDILYASMLIHMGKIVEAIHLANPKAKVVGVGYDTMFGGLGCSAVTHEIFPQCYKKGGGGNRCFNTQFIRIQGMWDDIGANRSWVHPINILGTTQVRNANEKCPTRVP
jgi:hypothetical protein